MRLRLRWGNNDTSRAVRRVDSRQLRSDCAVSSRRLFAKYLRFYAAANKEALVIGVVGEIARLPLPAQGVRRASCPGESMGFGDASEGSSARRGGIRRDE